MLRKKIKKINTFVIMIFSLVSISISFFIITYKIFSKYQNDLNNNIQVEKYFEIEKNTEDDVLDVNDNNDNAKTVGSVKKIEENYIGILSIEKINFQRGFYKINSKLNNVNKNIEVLKSSNMPDVYHGNIIIAGHSGTSKTAYFKNLNKLELGDIAKVNYQTKTYNYELVKIYEIDKTSNASIIRNQNKNTLTLITCKRKSNQQLIFIFELEERGK